MKYFLYARKSTLFVFPRTDSAPRQHGGVCSSSFQDDLSARLNGDAETFTEPKPEKQGDDSPTLILIYKKL